MSFQEKLDLISKKNNSLVCVGLDSDLEKLPEQFKLKENPQFEFNKAIIDATHDLVCAYKPNSAFYEARGAEGIKDLKMTFDYINQTYPEIVTILDAKRADIGNTNNGYVTFAFDYLNADSITLHPYLGKEALSPFLERKDKASIILCHTTNPGAGELQDLTIDGKPFYQIVATNVATEWNTNNNCFLVLGAKYPEQMAEVRKLTGDLTFLVPGIGAQGGDIEKTLKAGLNSQKSGLIINSSRGIIFASTGEDFAEKAKEATTKLRDEINTYR
jgi:orotidine-5'-phosphate decarboxylase